jgi:hypothetical protein
MILGMQIIGTKVSWSLEGLEILSANKGAGGKCSPSWLVMMMVITAISARQICVCLKRTHNHSRMHNKKKSHF